MSCNESKLCAIREILVSAGVRQELVDAFSLVLVHLLVPVDQFADGNHYDFVAAQRFEIEREWGG